MQYSRWYVFVPERALSQEWFLNPLKKERTTEKRRKEGKSKNKTEA